MSAKDTLAYQEPSSHPGPQPPTMQTQYTQYPIYMSPCANGHHYGSTRFGLCGILTAIFCFPIGLICLCLDTEKVCSRCGVRLS